MSTASVLPWGLPLLLLGLTTLPHDTTTSPRQSVARQRPRPPAISTRDATNYAHEVRSAAVKIANEYVKEVKPETLAAHAIHALYATADTPLPVELRGDPEKIFVGADVGEELRKARIQLGNAPGIVFPKDVRLSIQAMLTSLDPYSMYLSVDDSMRFSQRGQCGIGILLEEREPGGPCFVQCVTLDGPAQQAGLRPGDEILAINGIPVPPDQPARLVAQELEGAPNSIVELLIRHLNQEPTQTIKVQRGFPKEDAIMGHRRLGSAPDASWEYMLGTKEKIALIRLGTITGLGEMRDDSLSASEQLGEILSTLQVNGLTGLVLDLRDCPGGSLRGALEVTSYFVPRGTLASTRYRTPNPEPPFQAQRMEHGLYRTPMTVLIGPNTMGGGELIAAALQDHGRAVLVGQRTRGKASIQQTITIDRGVAYHQIRLTTGYFLRPKGGNLNRFANNSTKDEWGVHPDPGHEVRLPPMMLRHVRVWRSQLDSGEMSANSPVPFTRLENDPVLNAAVRHLLKKE